MATIEELKKISVGWRFTSEDYNLLSEKIIDSIKINSLEKSNREWYALTKCKEPHLMRLPDEFWKNLSKMFELKIEWGEENLSECKAINEIIDNQSCEMITFFWGANTSIEITWSLFVQYWDDFCYPDDENNLIIVYSRGLIVTFVEERLTFYSLTSL